MNNWQTVTGANCRYFSAAKQSVKFVLRTSSCEIYSTHLILCVIRGNLIIKNTLENATMIIKSLPFSFRFWKCDCLTIDWQNFLSFDFYPKVVTLSVIFWLHGPPLLPFQTDRMQNTSLKVWKPETPVLHRQLNRKSPVKITKTWAECFQRKM